MCHDMCKCFGRVGENREGMETGDAAICVAPRRERRFGTTDIDDATLISIHAPAKGATSWTAYDHSRCGNFNPRSGAARHIALHELLGTQYACQEDHFELQQTAENIS